MFDIGVRACAFHDAASLTKHRCCFPVPTMPIPRTTLVAAGKPLPPDDYEGVSTKYSRERQRHAAAEREQRERAVKQREREQCANGQALPDSRRAWEEGRDRCVRPELSCSCMTSNLHLSLGVVLRCTHFLWVLTPDHSGCHHPRHVHTSSRRLRASTVSFSPFDTTTSLCCKQTCTPDVLLSRLCVRPSVRPLQVAPT